MSKKTGAIILLIVFTISLQSLFVQANLYQTDSLTLQLDIGGDINLKPDGNDPRLKEVSTDLLLLPQNDYRQNIQMWESEGEKLSDRVSFKWTDGKIVKKNYGYSTEIKTNTERIKIGTKIQFPIPYSKVENLNQYLQPTKSIDSDNPKIIAQASELIEGEDDLFKAVFLLAEWVERNVNYDLNTLTETASQKASWVLDNRQGVCDEMTSLFVAMARSLGIPARFASGISYTTSPLFSENWQPHGWAEVFFPGYGWVSFDITFGEYGYIDTTHIKLRDGFDPQEAATKFSWLANDVKLEASDLNFAVKVKNKGNRETELFSLEQQLLSKEVGFGSFNQVIGTIRNHANYYTAVTLKLAVPPEVEIIGRNRRTILLPPNAIRETFWKLKVKEDLESNTIYTMPTFLYTEQNISVQDSFQVRQQSQGFSQEEIEKLSIEDEDKLYSRKINFNCNYPTEVWKGELNDKSKKAICSIKNTGNTNLKQLKFCLNDKCSMIDLPINQIISAEYQMTTNKVGWNKIIISAENDVVEKKSSIEYAVLDEPNINLKTDFPKSINYGEKIPISIELTKKSFSTPKNVIVILNGAGFENRWELDELKEIQRLPVELVDFNMGSKNNFEITVMWKDKDKTMYSTKGEIKIKGVGKNFGDKISLFFNQILNWFY